MKPSTTPHPCLPIKDIHPPGVDRGQAPFILKNTGYEIEVFPSYSLPSVPGPKEHWEMVRSAIVHEDNLTNHRLTWLLTAHGFLLAGFAVMQLQALTIKEAWAQAIVEAFLAVLFFAGMWLSCILGTAVRLAGQHISQLADWYCLRYMTTSDHDGAGQVINPGVNIKLQRYLGLFDTEFQVYHKKAEIQPDKTSNWLIIDVGSNEITCNIVNGDTPLAWYWPFRFWPILRWFGKLWRSSRWNPSPGVDEGERHKPLSITLKLEEKIQERYSELFVNLKESEYLLSDDDKKQIRQLAAAVYSEDVDQTHRFWCKWWYLYGFIPSDHSSLRTPEPPVSGNFAGIPNSLGIGWLPRIFWLIDLAGFVLCFVLLCFALYRSVRSGPDWSVEKVKVIEELPGNRKVEYEIAVARGEQVGGPYWEAEYQRRESAATKATEEADQAKAARTKAEEDSTKSQEKANSAIGRHSEAREEVGKVQKELDKARTNKQRDLVAKLQGKLAQAKEHMTRAEREEQARHAAAKTAVDAANLAASAERQAVENARLARKKADEAKRERDYWRSLFQRSLAPP